MKSLAKRKKDPNSKYWQAKAMGEWGRIVHAQGRCAVCKSLGEHHGDKLDAHHLVTRSAPSCRYDPANGILLCPLHHLYSQELSAHKAPMAFILWLEKHEPDKYAYLKRNAFYHPTIERTSAQEWYEILKEY